MNYFRVPSQCQASATADLSMCTRSPGISVKVRTQFFVQVMICLFGVKEFRQLQKKKRSEPSSAGVKEVALLRIKLCKLLAIWDLGRVLYSSKKIRQKYVERCVLLYYSMSNSSYLHILYLFVLFVLFSALLPFHASSTK